MRSLSPSQLRAEAERHRAIAAKFDEAADLMTEGKSPKESAVIEVSPKRSPKTTHTRRKKRAASDGTTRVEELKSFLNSHGAMRRKDIRARSGIPTGTLSTYLKPGYGFTKDDKGRWAAKNN